MKVGADIRSFIFYSILLKFLQFLLFKEGTQSPRKIIYRNRRSFSARGRWDR